MRVAAVQFKAQRPDVDRSRGALVALASDAAANSDLVVCPEMAATGYLFPSAEAVADVAEDAGGPTFRALSEIAREHGTWIVAGFPERDGALLYNSALIINAEGALEWVYRKTLLYEQDVSWATPGNSGYRRFNIGSSTFTPGICMDLNDAFFTRWIQVSRSDVVAFPTNWVDEGSDVHAYWRLRLKGSKATLVAANTWGTEGDTRFSGRSAIMGSDRVSAEAGFEGDAVIRATVPIERPVSRVVPRPG